MLDKQAALERLDHDTELYEEICTLFKTESRDLLDRLRAALHSGDAASATRCAHSLKSISASIGAAELSSLAFTAEELGKNGQLSRMAELLPELEKGVSAVIDEL